jgi:hypothetical protein
MQKPNGSFHNYLSYERHFLDVDGSEDAAGRALWACGATVNSKLPSHLRMVAKDIFANGLPWVWKTTHLRYIASTILGLKEYHTQEPSECLKADTGKLGQVLVQHFKDESKEDWRWFEPTLTYDNARLVQALFAAHTVVGDPKFLEVAEDAMAFLVKTQLIDGVFVPIGNDGWYHRGGERAIYDQQPIEASAMVDAALEGYLASGDRYYVDVADDVFEWFLGRNTCKLWLYNPETAGCCDGLSPERVNLNQGAESSICYLLARLRLEEAHRGLLVMNEI